MRPRRNVSAKGPSAGLGMPCRERSIESRFMTRSRASMMRSNSGVPQVTRCCSASLAGVNCPEKRSSRKISAMRESGRK